MPDKGQWWITGFNPHYTEPEPSKMVMVSSVDFSKRNGMYQAFKESYKTDKPINVIFDDELETVWFVWL